MNPSGVVVDDINTGGKEEAENSEHVIQLIQ